MSRVLHVIQNLAPGGGALRSVLAASKYSAKQGPFRHAIASLLPPGAEGAELAREAGVEVIDGSSRERLRSELEAADIVQVSFWNSPEMYDLLREELPPMPMRLCVWFHIAGDGPPQIVTREVVDFADVALASSPYCHRESVLPHVPPEERPDRSAMVYDAADFARLEGFAPRAHDGFNVGYVGTASFNKLHPDFVSLCASIEIPDVRFVLCTSGSAEPIRQQAAHLGIEQKFDLRGYVPDIRPALEVFDVFGYPLRDDTYASGELVLQEAMFAGVPPVVFPHGGIRDLVHHDFTGMVVSSAREYREAIEHLWREPEERARLSRNAREYAAQIFGAENAARPMNEVYRRLLDAPKRGRVWGAKAGVPLLEQEVRPADLDASDEGGVAAFLEGLGAHAERFRRSMDAPPSASSFPSDEAIGESSDLLRSGVGGIASYRDRFPEDPWLRFFHALVLLREERRADAAGELRAAIEGGVTHWRLQWYLARAAAECGHTFAARRALDALGDRAELDPDVLRSVADAVAAQEATLARASALCGQADAPAAARLVADARARWSDSPDFENAELEQQILFGDAARAERALVELAARHPEHPRVLNNVAVLHYRSGRVREATDLLERALALCPGDRAIAENLDAVGGTVRESVPPAPASAAFEPPPWTDDELRAALEEFAELYRERPFESNDGGMKSPHLFPTWFAVRQLQPGCIIESGVFRGQGTWFLERAAPNARLICLEPNLDAIRYVSSRAEYRSEDFSTHDWLDVPRERTLCFFDDHQDALERVRLAERLGFEHLMFEDNYPIGHGDCRSLKQVVDSGGPDLDYLRRTLSVYYEFPPVFRQPVTRWGTPWTDQRYPTPAPLCRELDRESLRVYLDEYGNYTWICYARLR